ncbi:DNA mismatch repair protein MutT [Sulfolobus acidocaldarius SUSAZ]|nr:DNA mismatch repair protein MutT [Sulfolobus acidocaldarius SUSAZ]
MERPLVAVGGVILKDNKVLLVKRRNPPNKGNWAIPGGKVEYGETLVDAVKREMKEETALDVEPIELLAVVEIIKEGYHYVIFDFICKVVNGELNPGSDATSADFLGLEDLYLEKVSPTTIEMLKRYFNGEKTPLFIVEKSVTQTSK